MPTFSRAVSALLLVVMANQAGCYATRALVKAGDRSQEPVIEGTPATEQPAGYTRAFRRGRMLRLEYDATVDADGAKHDSPNQGVSIDLAGISWRPLATAEVDPRCGRDAWQALPSALTRDSVPLVAARSFNLQDVAAIHRRQATGSPPLTIQLQGLDAWIVCGEGDDLAYAKRAAPPPPEKASPGRSSGALPTAAIVILFPFALIADTALAAGYVVYFIGKGL